MGRLRIDSVRVLLTGALLAAAAAAAGPAAAQDSAVLPQTGALALIGGCALTLDGEVYRGCECRLMVSAAGAQYLMSGLNVACQGQAGQAGLLSSQVGQPGRTIQVLYDLGPTTAHGAGMWLTSSTASIENVVADDDWLLMTLRLAGPTGFENSRGRACVDGATGARC
ncbi:MAG: hypothetical protein ACFCVH_10970 [Alphaproteobacteria bacterium]